MQYRGKEKAVLCGVTLFALTSCVGGSAKGLPELPPAAHTAPAEAMPGLVPDEPVKIGDPYQIAGRTYTPQAVKSYDDVGYASWYGGDFEGKPTANGETFAAARISAAHKTLPLPSYAEVTSLQTGRTIVVRINDRGPFSNDRLIDLSAAAASQLGIADHGVAPVRVRMVNPPSSERVALRSGRAVAERIPTPESLLRVLRSKLADADAAKTLALAAPSTTPVAPVKTVAPVPAPAPAKPAPVVVAVPAPPKKAPSVTGPMPERADALVGHGAYMVQIGAFSSKANAEAVAKKAGGKVYPAGNIFRVRTGPYQNAAEANKGVARAKANGYPEARAVRAD